jgi:hypothetical protein
MEMGAWISPVLTAALLACTTVGPALAGDYDGSKPLICAALQATSCQPDGQCKQGTAESLNLPQFFWIDGAAKTISEKGPDGQIRTSPVQTSTQSASHWILQGTTDHLGWNATISKVSGRVMLMATDGASAQIVFGACTPGK